MAQYYTDFGLSTTGNQVPDGWTHQWQSIDYYSVVESTEARADQMVEYVGDDTFRQALTWDEVGSQTDCEIWMRMRIHNDQSGTQGGMRARVSGSSGNETGVGFEMNYAVGGWDMTQYVDGTWTNDLAHVNVNPALGEWWHTRLRLSSSTMDGKAWHEDDTEPSSWQATATTDVTSGGPIGMGMWQPNLKYVDAFGVGTNGDPAPTSRVLVPVDGTVQLDDGTALEGATIVGINEERGAVEDTTTTASDGTYTLQMESGKTVHVTMEYDDGTDAYQAQSKPFITPQ